MSKEPFDCWGYDDSGRDASKVIAERTRRAFEKALRAAGGDSAEDHKRTQLMQREPIYAAPEPCRDTSARHHVEHGPEDHHDHPAQAVPVVVNNSNHGSHLPTDAKARKALPICTGVLDYFPDALAAVAEVSRIGNDQHNPGQPLHWAKGKSTDHADCAIRHFAERGTVDTDGGRHTAKAAWRVLALLQMEIEAERAGLSFNDYIAKLNREAA